ncbi:type I pullulanase [Vagococcus silagei]|nr:type I pullulanase [Vagococcus silagei]
MKPSYYSRKEAIRECAIESIRSIKVVLKDPEIEFNTEETVLISKEGQKTSLKMSEMSHQESELSVVFKTDTPLTLTESYEFSLTDDIQAPVMFGAVVRTPEFDETFFYDGQLGASYSKDETEIKLWAPTAQSVVLKIYDGFNEDSPVKQKIQMKQTERGTYTTVLSGDQDQLVYTFQLTFADGSTTESPDPYATAAIVNGMRSVVVNPETVALPGQKRLPAFSSATDAIIYETHIRDLTIAKNSGVALKGKFLGAIEEGTQTPTGQKTGFDYICDLGVTHVQFLPMYDYGTVDEAKPDVPQYNWGYDPQNYNVPEGSYSTDATNPKTRILEMKQMIEDYHDKGLRVIMDVVYNHVFEVPNHPFHLTVPGYFFRYLPDGYLADGTGVNNDVASERKMVRKYIVDSIEYWTKNYNLDGFRFDLMGILDVETMNEVRRVVDKIDPSIIILGEGWNLDTPLAADKKAIQKNANQMPSIAHFNDSLRDSVKGHVFYATEPGMVNGGKGLEKLVIQNMLGANGLEGYQNPNQVVQYVEAHDNYTLYDKLVLTNPNDTEDIRRKRHTLSTGIAMLSQGISFIHAGQEFLRTKSGDENSYRSTDAINQFDWSRVEAEHEAVTFFKELVSLRKSEPLFRMTSYEDIKQHSTVKFAEEGQIIFELFNDEQHYLISINTNEESRQSPFDLSDYQLILSNHATETEHFTFLPLSLSVYKK